MIAAIGAFDGFHLGHQALLERASANALLTNSRWGVVTFMNHPDGFFAGSSRGSCAAGGSGSFKPLFTQSEQLLLERFFSIPVVCRIDFTQKIAEMAPEEFLDFIGSEFGVDGVVVGEDFLFAKNRSGDTAGLCKSCLRRGWPADVIPMRLSASGKPICSTAIRNAVASGEMKLAWGLLGYPFFLRSKVVHGYNRGTSLGFPTANIEIDPRKAGMRHGVYATLAFASGVWHTGAANVGLNPTFADIQSPRFEVNLLDYEGDLYGSEITVFMLHHIRDEIRFAGADDLTAQIARDSEVIRQISAQALSEHATLWEKFAAMFA